MLGVTQADFPLPKLGPKLRQLVEEGVHGRGFQMLRCAGKCSRFADASCDNLISFPANAFEAILIPSQFLLAPSG